MKTVFLISCVKKKRNIKCKTKDLYISPLFVKSYKYAQQQEHDEIFILSAKYGLLELNDTVEPYDLTLNKMNKDEKEIWSKKVVEQLSKKVSLKNDKFIVLAGKNYYEKILPYIYEIPMLNLSQGKRIQWLNKHLKSKYLLF